MNSKRKAGVAALAIAAGPFLAGAVAAFIQATGDPYDTPASAYVAFGALWMVVGIALVLVATVVALDRPSPLGPLGRARRIAAFALFATAGTALFYGGFTFYDETYSYYPTTRTAFEYALTLIVCGGLSLGGVVGGWWLLDSDIHGPRPTRQKAVLTGVATALALLAVTILLGVPSEDERLAASLANAAGEDAAAGCTDQGKGLYYCDVDRADGTGRLPYFLLLNGGLWRAGIPAVGGGQERFVGFLRGSIDEDADGELIDGPGSPPRELPALALRLFRLYRLGGPPNLLVAPKQAGPGETIEVAVRNGSSRRTIEFGLDIGVERYTHGDWQDANRLVLGRGGYPHKAVGLILRPRRIQRSWNDMPLNRIVLPPDLPAGRYRLYKAAQFGPNARKDLRIFGEFTVGRGGHAN